MQDGVWACKEFRIEALESPNQLAKGWQTFKMVVLTVFSLKTAVKIIISNSIPLLICISVRTVKKPYVTVKYKWIFVFYTRYCTALTCTGIPVLSILFSPVLNDMTKMCQNILFYYCHYSIFANVLVSSAFLKMANIYENYEIISSVLS